MPHIHSASGQHDLTISAFIVRTDGPEPTVMLHQHRKIGRLMQFGGHVELNETPWQGLLRELREEAGYDINQLSLLQPPHRFTEHFQGLSMHPLPFSFNTHFAKGAEEHFHSDLTYAAIAAEPPRYQIREGESAAIYQFTAAQITELPDAQIFHITRANALFVLGQLLGQWETVPATEWPA